MKKAIFIKTLVLSAIVFLSCAAKAQSDTAWMDTNYIDQYIFPPLVDERWEDEYRYGWYGDYAPFSGYLMCDYENWPDEFPTPADYVAQKYEAEDSVTLAGVAVLMEGSPFDSLTVEIWRNISSMNVCSTNLLPCTMTIMFRYVCTDAILIIFRGHWLLMFLLIDSYQPLSFRNFMIMLISLKDAT